MQSTSGGDKEDNNNNNNGDRPRKKIKLMVTTTQEEEQRQTRTLFVAPADTDDAGTPDAIEGEAPMAIDNNEEKEKEEAVNAADSTINTTNSGTTTTTPAAADVLAAAKQEIEEKQQGGGEEDVGGGGGDDDQEMADAAEADDMSDENADKEANAIKSAEQFFLSDPISPIEIDAVEDTVVRNMQKVIQLCESSNNPYLILKEMKYKQRLQRQNRHLQNSHGQQKEKDDAMEYAAMHASYTIRDYQQALLDIAKRKNIIVHLGTGKGTVTCTVIVWGRSRFTLILLFSFSACTEIPATTTTRPTKTKLISGLLLFISSSLSIYLYLSTYIFTTPMAGKTLIALRLIEYLQDEILPSSKSPSSNNDKKVDGNSNKTNTATASKKDKDDGDAGDGTNNTAKETTTVTTTPPKKAGGVRRADRNQKPQQRPDNTNNKKKQTVFLVPSVALALQQTSVLKSNLPRRFKVGTACSKTFASESQRVPLSRCHVLVATQ